MLFVVSKVSLFSSMCVSVCVSVSVSVSVSYERIACCKIDLYLRKYLVGRIQWRKWKKKRFLSDTVIIAVKQEKNVKIVSIKLLQTELRKFKRFIFVRFYQKLWRPAFQIHSRHFYRPQRSCGQGYVFTRVCDSCSQGGGVSRQGELPPDRENPPGREEHPLDRENPLQGRTPWQGGTPPRQGEPPQVGRTPLDQADPPGQGEPPLDQAHPPLGSRLQNTFYERPVRILLECILVEHYFSF